MLYVGVNKKIHEVNIMNKLMYRVFVCVCVRVCACVHVGLCACTFICMRMHMCACMLKKYQG